MNPKPFAVAATFLLLSVSALAQGAPTTTPWTVADIYKAAAHTGGSLNGAQWTPDGKRLTFLAGDDKFGGEAGDLVAYDVATGSTAVLITHTKLAALLTPPGNEKDKDHRARYGAANYIWGPDSKHLLFDSAGQLTVVDANTGTGVHVASSGAGSGDDPKFSPNGRHLCYIRGHNLYLAALRGGAEVALTNTGNEKLLNGDVDWVYLEELDVRSNYFWSPDSNRIAYLQSNEEDVPVYPLVDWIPTHATTDAQRYPQPGDANPTVRVGVTGLKADKTVWLNIPLSAKNDYIPRFGWADARTVWVEILKRDHKIKELWLADAVSGNAHKIFSEGDQKFFDESYDVKFIDRSRFIWTSWRDGHTHLYLYSYDLHGNGEARLVTQLTAGDFEVGGLSGVNEAQQKIFYASSEGNPLEEHLWSVSLDGRDKHPLPSQPGVQRGEFSDDGMHYVEFSSSYTDPPSTRVCSVSGDCKPLTQGTAPTGHLVTAPIAIEGKASDGATTLYGQLLMPATTQTASIPLIVNPYGGPHAQTVRNGWGGANTLFDQLLVEHGFAVLHVDNRGMGGRGARFEYAAYRNFGPVQLADQLAVLDQVLQKYPQLDAKRLGWWGWSWGGTFTLYAMTHSDRFKAGVAVAAVTDWRNYDSIYTERYMGTPSENLDGYKADAVVNSASALHGHLLMAHGTGDDNVHLGNTIQFIQALIAAGKPYDLQLYPRKTHSIAGIEARTHLFERILAQFETYLKPTNQ